MPKIDLNGWKLDIARREDRKAHGLCPMCGASKRAEDDFCSDECKDACSEGAPSKETPK